MSVVLLIAACTQIQSAEDAPFALKGKHVVFIGDGNGDHGVGALVISDDPLECEALPPRPDDVISDRIAAGGSGLVMVLTYTLPAPAAEPWLGEYTSTSTERLADPLAWQDGELLLPDPAGTRVEITTFDDTQAVAEFDTQWWSGKVKADLCELDTEIECRPTTANAFLDQFADKACLEWDSCSDEPCNFELTGICLGFAPDAAAECLCVPWVCQDGNLGFEYVEIPSACDSVCASNQ